MNPQGADGQPEGSPPGGLFASLRGVFVTVLGIARTRIELIGIEVAQERERLVGLLITAVAAVFALSFAALLLTMMVVVLFWESRLIALGVCTAVYTLAGAWLVTRLHTQLAEHPPLFAATIAELEKDRDALRAGMQRPEGVPPQP